MENIEKWIKENIIVDRFPVHNELKENGKHGSCNVIINVSDEFWLGESENVVKEGKLGYYFPMGERAELGLPSMYGVLQVLYSIYTYNPEWKILIHCQAGLNRSPTVKSAFYYMLLDKHEDIKDNRLLYNCESGYLPPLDKMEKFIKSCKFTFDNSDKFLGGIYDWVLEESGLSNNVI